MPRQIDEAGNPMNRGRATVVAVLGSTQTLAWASSYYVPAILGVPIAAGLGVSPSVFFGAFSASLLLSAAIGPWIGRLIDQYGGRAVLTTSSAVLAARLAMLRICQRAIRPTFAWLLLPIGIAAAAVP